MRDYSGKYKYYNTTDASGRKVTIAVSTYEGKTVKGYAKCDVNDTYTSENGERLAAARCNERVARKRAKRAAKKLAEAKQNVMQAQAHLAKMVNYFEDSQEALIAASADVASILKTL